VKRSRSKTGNGDQSNASKSRSAMPTDLSEKIIQGCLLLKILKLPICGMRDADTTVGACPWTYPISCQASTSMLLWGDLAS
jgi:hypothetical protein